MNILVATPCLTGFTHTYVSSLVGLVQGFEINTIPFQTLFLANESCIQRARNDIVQYALASTEKFTHLFFVDSDMGFEWDDFARLANAKRRIIAGMCVKKTYPITYVVTPKDFERPDESGVLRVNHAPVAFMLIDLGVFRTHSHKVKTYSGVSAITGKREEKFNWFPAGPDVNGNFLAEDHAFTALMRECGESIYLHTRVKTTHTGLHTFRSAEETPL